MASPSADRKALQDAQKAHADGLKLEKLARINPCVRALLAECESLRAEVAALRTAKASGKAK